MDTDLILYKDIIWKPRKSFEYTGEVKEFSLTPGTYLFVANGAKGGDSTSNAFKSCGGTTYGILDLDHEQTFYAAVGGNGENTSNTAERPKGGFNGGGNGGLAATRDYQNGAGGGGASDIRIRNDGIIIVEDKRTHTLPEGIEEVEYIQSDGTQYINTNFIHKSDTKIECVCSVSNNSGRSYQALFGSRFPQLVLFTRFEGDRINFAVASLNDSQSRGPAMTYDQKMKIVVNKNNVTMYDMNDVEVLTYTNPATQVDGVYPLLLFDLNHNGNPDNSKTIAKIYSFKIMNNDNVLVRDLVPFKNAGGVAMDTSDIVFEQGTIYTSGDADSSSRVRSVGYIEVDPVYPCMSGLSNDLQVSIMEYDENKTCIVDGPWQAGGTISTLNASTKFVRIVLRYSNDTNFTPAAVTSFSLYKHMTTASSGLYDAVEGKVYTKGAGNNFTIGPSMIRTIDSGLYSRIFVAGGGGGTGCQTNNNSYQDFLSFGGGPESGWVVAGSSATSTNWAYTRANQTSGASFGIGANAQDRTYIWNSAFGMEGQSGGGGGWYGGYALRGLQQSSNSYTASNGSGGTSYVLTESSYKPDDYMYGVEDLIPSLYFRDFMMLPCQAFNGPSITVYEKTDNIFTGNILRVPYTGEKQKVSLLPGTYRIKCYGGDGGVRWHASHTGKGGYAEGVVSLKNVTDLDCRVGSSSYLVGMGSGSATHDSIFNNRMSFNVKIGSYANHLYGATAGGGATDIRLTVSSHKVPDEYDQIEYIESNATQYIDLNYYFNASISKFEVVTSLKNPESVSPPPNYQVLFGQRSPGPSMMFMLLYRDVGVNRTVLGTDGSYTYGEAMPYDTKIRIVATAQNTFTWYDMNGSTIGSMNPGSYSFTSPLHTYLFGFNEDGNRSTLSRAKVYSFKIYENNMLVHWFVPIKSKPEAEEQLIGMYDLVDEVIVTSPIGDPFVCGDIVEKTEYENERESLLSRIIVAGGGGGQGANDLLGGNGGGLAGTSFRNGGYGTNNGPGTQTGTPAQSTAGGGFGFNGVGTYYNGGYGGSGGNGWFGGNGTEPDGSGDDDKGGSGGSGYVLTESSYKPTGYIPDSQYWLTDTQLITGGNPVRNMTCIEITAESVSAVYVIAQDEYSYKSYNTDTNTWESIAISELTPEVFDEYGISSGSIISDEGLMDVHRFYVYDRFNTGVDKIRGLVIPTKQHVQFTEYSTLEILDDLYDADCDDNVDINLEYTITGIAENRRLNMDLSFDMTDVPSSDTTVYIVQFKTRAKPTSYYYPTKPEKTIDKLDLLRVGTGDIVPNRYKTHIGSFMPDGVTAITSVMNSSSCEYKRNIYTASLLNNSVIRITRFNIIENKSYIVRDNIPVTVLDLSNTACTGGSILVDDEYIYLSNSCMLNRDYLIRILRIPIDPSKPYTTYNAPASDTNYYVNAYGRMEWVSPTMILLLTQYGFVRFNTLTTSFTFVPDTDTNGGRRNEMCVGKYTVLTFWESDECVGPRVYDKTSLTRISFPGSPWDAYEPGTKCICYDDGKFYLTQTGHLYIISDNPDHDVRTPDEHILTPYTSYQPKTISVSNGLIYVTISGDVPTLYIYNMKVKQWISTALPFNTGVMDNRSWYRPASFKGFFFIGNLKLYVANFNNYTKYKVGQKSNVLMIQTNDTHPGSYVYDERFITIDNIGIHFNTGYIEKQLMNIDESNHIYQSEDFIKNSEYKQIISYEITTTGEEEDDNNG